MSGHEITTQVLNSDLMKWKHHINRLEDEVKHLKNCLEKASRDLSYGPHQNKHPDEIYRMLLEEEKLK